MTTPPEPTWEAFLEGLVTEYAPAPDRVLWRVTKLGREIIYSLRESQPSTVFVARELRVVHNGEIYLTESHKELVTFQRRVEELRRLLEADGWIPD